MTAGSYPDDGLGEVFLKLGKQGSTLAGVMDAFSIAISIALQHGVPLETYVQKFTNMRFEPAGLTDDPDIRMAQSVLDYIFRRLALDYLPFETRAALGIHTADGAHPAARDRHRTAPDESTTTTSRRWRSRCQSRPMHAAATPTDEAVARRRPSRLRPGCTARPSCSSRCIGSSADAPLCMNCGTKMRPAGSCFVCEGCGSTSGCS